MPDTKLLLGAAALLLAACGAPEAPTHDPVPPTPDAAAIEAHMAYLASDELEGREAGTPGYALAADYVAAQMEEIGLAPAGDDGAYFQQVPLVRSLRNGDAASLSITGPDGAPLPFAANEDYVVWNSTRYASSAVSAPAVFVGFGVVAPAEGRDDYAGLDVDGKIVVMLSGTPKGIQTEERAFYGTRKSQYASERGAVGIISIETPTQRARLPFERIVREHWADRAGMSWLNADGETHTIAPNIQASAFMNMEAGAELFAGVEADWDAIIAAAEAEGGAVPTMELPYTISLAQESTLETINSPNVVGMIEGSDPKLADEVIVLSAHLDHIGITQSMEDDRINNGALDNAAGISTMLDAARMIMAGERPRRSIMILAVTAEEKGLLGAQYFAQNPTIPAEHIVANVNLDMPILTYDFTDLIVFGATRSTIIDSVRTVTDEMGLALADDPFPDQGLFTRSDHFRFVEAGIPSVYLVPGLANGGEEGFANHMANNYHQPSDDMSNTIDFNAAARFAEMKARIAVELANADTRPLWTNGDFFALQFDGPMTE